MNGKFVLSPRLWRALLAVLLVGTVAMGLAGAGTPLTAHAAGDAGAQFWAADAAGEEDWHPGYLGLATGTWSGLPQQGEGYAWPLEEGAPFTVGHVIQSYQYYGGKPYFHHGMDLMAQDGTALYSRSGGQVINVERYSTMYLYWEVAILDPNGFIWVYHHIERRSIPQLIFDKFAEWQAEPVSGGYVPPDTHIGNIVKWTDKAFNLRTFNHLHLNVLGAGGVYLNPLDFHRALPDMDKPEILEVGLLQGGGIYPGDQALGDYSLYVHARDLVLDNMYYLPPYAVTFSLDGGPANTTWQFDDLPGGADDKAYLSGFYAPPTCGDYHCREFYINLGFKTDGRYVFPATAGPHTVDVTVRDYAGNTDSRSFTYIVAAPPAGTIEWRDTFEGDTGWVANPSGTDTASLGMWERGAPEATDLLGPKQLNFAATGSAELATGLLAGPSPFSHEVDGGVTSIRSPAITLPADGKLSLSFYYTFAHGVNSSPDDFFRVKVLGSSTATTVFEKLGTAEDIDADWALATVGLDAFKGQTVHLLVEAADGGPANLVEAAIDDVQVIRQD